MTGCSAAVQGTPLKFTVKYIKKIPIMIPRICKYTVRGKLPIKANTSMKIGILNPNRWTSVTCFLHSPGSIKIADPAKKN